MLNLITPPAVEPVTIAEAKLQVRVDHALDDLLISNDILVARETIEKRSQRALITQTWDYWLDAFPTDDYLTIPLPPLQSITSIKYYDVNNTEFTLSVSDYFVDTKSEPGRVALADGASWPGTTLRKINGVAVRFVAGYGAAGSSVPQMLRQVILFLVGHFYENREATSQGIYKLPFGVDDLLWNFFWSY